MIEFYLICIFSTFVTFDENKCDYAEASSQSYSITLVTCIAVQFHFYLCMPVNLIFFSHT